MLGFTVIPYVTQEGLMRRLTVHAVLVEFVTPCHAHSGRLAPSPDASPCTVAMILSRASSTYAHKCLARSETGFERRHAARRFVAGRNDLTFPYGTAKGVRASVPNAYRSLADADTGNSNYGSRRPFDWAVRCESVACRCQ